MPCWPDSIVPPWHSQDPSLSQADGKTLPLCELFWHLWGRSLERNPSSAYSALREGRHPTGQGCVSEQQAAAGSVKRGLVVQGLHSLASSTHSRLLFICVWRHPAPVVYIRQSKVLSAKNTSTSFLGRCAWEVRKVTHCISDYEKTNIWKTHTRTHTQHCWINDREELVFLAHEGRVSYCKVLADGSLNVLDDAFSVRGFSSGKGGPESSRKVSCGDLINSRAGWLGNVCDVQAGLLFSQTRNSL